MDWGQIESGQVTLVTQRVNPLPILQQVVAQARDRVRKGVAVKTAYPSTLPAVQADPTRLQQILLNLMGNALKFTTHGSITLEARVEDRFLRFAVADTGRGIAKTAQATLFELYSQGSPEIRRCFGGSGLGLTISKQFVERQGGHIWIESEEGKGSTFFFTVPLADVPNQAHEIQ